MSVGTYLSSNGLLEDNTTVTSVQALTFPLRYILLEFLLSSKRQFENIMYRL